jgi:hypothetical protein
MFDDQKKADSMKKILVTGATVFAMIGLSGLAFAGAKADGQVKIDLTNRSASGALGAARNSADAVQYIGCTVINSTTGASGYSVAMDAQGQGGSNAMCTISTPEMVNTARSISESQNVKFAWDSSGKCTSLVVSNYSTYEPKR